MEEEEENKIKRDKIFDNDFMSSEAREKPKSFSPKFRDKTIDERFDENIASKLISNLIESDFDLNRYSTLDSEGKLPKINKVAINEIYSKVTTQLIDKIPRIEIFSVLVDYFDISPEKFYESLSNTFKSELIYELKNRGFLPKINSLF